MRLALLPTLFLAMGAMAMAPAAEDKSAGVAGIWTGALKVGPMALRLVVKIKAEGEGEKLTAKFDSPDQGANDIPIAETTFKDETLKLDMPNLKATFEGKRNKEKTEIAGEWKQSGLTFPITFKKVDKAPEIKRDRPQEPKKPYPYEEEEVSYENPAAQAKLAGTLTKPNGDGPFPAVLLVTGSGPQDRDETVFQHKPFWVLADYLTRRGLAVLRVDDRGVGKSTGSMKDATTADFAEDALAGVQYLKGRKDIDAKRIGLIGHSEGGLIAPIVAVKDPSVAFIVLWAGPGLTGEDILLLQGQRILQANGADEKALARQKNVQEKLFALVKAEKDNEALVKKAQQAIDELVAAADEKEKKAMEAEKGSIQRQIKSLAAPWMRHFLTYDPRPTLQKVRCPVLALLGEKDVQVPSKENIAALQKALEAGGNTNFTIKELAGLNHLFQTAKTGGVNEYVQIPETIAPTALETMGEWITQRVGK